MILILNGPTGVGKTTLAGLLMRALPGSFSLEGDHLEDTNPFNHADPWLSSEVNDLFAQITLYRLARRQKHAVLNWVFESKAELDDLRAKLAPAGQDIRVFYLTASDQSFEERILRRKTEDWEWELRRFKELKKVFAQRGAQGALGKELDTTRLSPEALRDLVLSYCGLSASEFVDPRKLGKHSTPAWTAWTARAAASLATPK